MPVAHYPRYRFPPAIISHAVWLYYRFTLSFRDVEDLLAQRDITVSYESIRHWCEIRSMPHRPNRQRYDASDIVQAALGDTRWNGVH
jgi:transposase-like protein